MKPTNNVYCLFLKIQFGSIKIWRFGMVRKRGERPLLTAPKNEYNFIGLRSYIHRATKLTSFFTPLLSLICVRLLSQFSCMRNPLVRVPLSIPNGSRDHPEGLAQAFGPSPERVGEAFSSVRPLSLPILPFLLVFPAPIYNKEKIIK